MFQALGTQQDEQTLPSSFPPMKKHWTCLTSNLGNAQRGVCDLSCIIYGGMSANVSQVGEIQRPFMYLKVLYGLTGGDE